VERTRLSVETKKAAQVSRGTCVGKSKRALAEIENTLDEPQDATEVMGLHVIDVAAGRESRDNDQRYAKTILVIALLAIQDGRGFVVVPATPIVPADQDGSVGPITLPFSHFVSFPMALTMEVTQERPPTVFPVVECLSRHPAVEILYWRVDPEKDCQACGSPGI
jgi:hypothetical protein